MRKIKNITVAFILLISFLNASELREVLNLKGTWKFYIGDDSAYSDPFFEDDHWDKIHVPDSWEEEGFPGYDGVAWYRTEFSLDRRHAGKHLLLMLGFIDDVDDVYLNGEKIGGLGSEPPQYITAYDKPRFYNIPKKILHRKKNVLAVRVYDNGGPGGIIYGKNIGIFESGKPVDILNCDLSGTWKFRRGNNDVWADPLIDDSHWERMDVPGNWNGHGLVNYDGFAWYRNKFSIHEIRPQHLVLFAGKIDDFERIYINGHLIGGTMPKFQEKFPRKQNHEWQKLREYYIPKSKINWNGVNTIAICVYDGYNDGGIIHGPVEILTRQEYQLRKENNNYNFYDIMEMIFNH